MRVSVLKLLSGQETMLVRSNFLTLIAALYRNGIPRSRTIVSTADLLRFQDNSIDYSEQAIMRVSILPFVRARDHVNREHFLR